MCYQLDVLLQSSVRRRWWVEPPSGVQRLTVAAAAGQDQPPPPQVAGMSVWLPWDPAATDDFVGGVVCRDISPCRLLILPAPAAAGLCILSVFSFDFFCLCFKLTCPSGGLAFYHVIAAVTSVRPLSEVAFRTRSQEVRKGDPQIRSDPLRKPVPNLRKGCVSALKIEGRCVAAVTTRPCPAQRPR